MITPWSQHWSSMTSEKNTGPPVKKTDGDACVVCVCVCVVCVCMCVWWISVCFGAELLWSVSGEQWDTGQEGGADKGSVSYASVGFLLRALMMCHTSLQNDKSRADSVGAEKHFERRGTLSTSSEIVTNEIVFRLKWTRDRAEQMFGKEVKQTFSILILILLISSSNRTLCYV